MLPEKTVKLKNRNYKTQIFTHTENIAKTCDYTQNTFQKTCVDNTNTLTQSWFMQNCPFFSVVSCCPDDPLTGRFRVFLCLRHLFRSNTHFMYLFHSIGYKYLIVLNNRLKLYFSIQFYLLQKNLKIKKWLHTLRTIINKINKKL